LSSTDSRVLALVEATPGLRKKVQVSSRFVDDLGFDSIMMVELMGTVEDEFNIFITLNDAVQVQQVLDLQRMVAQALTHSQAAEAVDHVAG
jgi:acyl carrier protein